MKKTKLQLWALGAGIGCNLLLFFVKLYVGLSANSICIWSDAVNNLADSLSCVLSFAFLAVAAKLGAKALPRVRARAQQLLSFVLAVIVALVGASFAYSSLERFFYPTPIWFSMKFFWLVLATAFVKLFLFFFFRAFAAKTGSSVIRVMQQDSLLDFCITLTTLLSFVLTQYVSFAIDAVFGMVIAVIILVSAVKMILTHTRALLNLVDANQRKKVESLISSFETIENLEEIWYDIGEDGAVTAVARAVFSSEANPQDAAGIIAEACLEETGIALRFLL